MSKSAYKLLYWPGIPGRGEFIRLAFEYAKRPLEQDLDPKSITSFMKPGSSGQGEAYALAPPMLQHDGHLISQTPNILLYVGDDLGLSGDKPIDKFYVNQLALTILDLNNEIHDTHHPVSVSAYYEDQKTESLRKAENVRQERIPKFLKYFNNILESNGSGFLVGSKASYADLCLFQVVDGLLFAFPKCMQKLQADKSFKAVFELKRRIEETPQIAEYLKSERRVKYGKGVFRYYPELDEQ